jgi:phage baseplate assembly protein gpV
MPNLYVNLPTPVGNGVGAAVDVSAFGKFKTIVVGNAVAAPFDQTVTIEVSQNAGFDFAPIISFTEVGKKTIATAAQFMRLRVSGFVSGSADVEVGANNNAGMFASLPVPAGNGVGAPVATTDFGRFKSVIVANPVGATFSGSVHVEASEDGVVFTDCLSFTKDDIQHKSFYAAFVRVRRSGFDPDRPGLPVVDLGAVNDTTSAVVPGPVPTRQQVYDASIPATIVLAAANGPIIFRDNAVPIGTLFEIQDSGATPLVSVDPLEFDVTIPTIDLNGATIVDIDSGVEVEITAPTVDIDAATIVDIDSATEVEITAPLLDFDGTTILIDAVAVLMLSGDMIDINGVTDVMIDAPLVDITGSTIVNINSATEVEITAPLLDLNVTTFDLSAVTTITLAAPTINLVATTLNFTGTPTFTLLGAGPMLIIEPTASSGAATIAQELRRDDGGVGAIGDGVAQSLSIMNSAGAVAEAFRVSAEWSDPTAGSEDSEVVFMISIAGVFAEGLRFRASGVDTQIVSPLSFILSPNAQTTDGLRITVVAGDTFVIPQTVANQFYLGNTIADPSVNLNRLAARAFDIIPLGTTVTAALPGNWIDMASTVVINTAPTGSLGGFVSVSGSVEFRLAGSAFGAGNLFKIQGTIKNESGALVSIGSQYTFVHIGTYQADGAYAQANFFHRICLFQPTWNIINGATMTVSTVNVGGLLNPTIGAGVTVTNMRDWEWSAVAQVGTIVNRAGLYMTDLAGGTTSTAGILSLITAGATRRFINHTGTAESDFGGPINLGSGATMDVQFSRGAANRFDLAAGDTMRLIAGTLQLIDGSQVISATAGEILLTATTVRTSAELEIDGTLDHDGALAGFYGVAPVAQSAAYTPTNVTTDRSYDANATTLDELADVVGTMIADLQSVGLFG